MSDVGNVPFHAPFPGPAASLRPGWWACSAPEKPVDDSVGFDLRCFACVVKAHAAWPTVVDIIVAWHPEPIRSWMIRGFTQVFADHGLPAR